MLGPLYLSSLIASILSASLSLTGHMLAQKGAQAAQEVAAAQKGIDQLGGGIPALHAIYLPERDEPHYLVVVEKVAPTPERYPRRVGLPSKRPLS